MIALFITFFSALVLVVFILAKYTYLTKKALAENGKTIATGSNNFGYLNIGCVILSLGIGLAVSSVFTMTDLSEDTMELLIYGTIVIFGGLGLILSHYVRKRIEDK